MPDPSKEKHDEELLKRLYTQLSPRLLVTAMEQGLCPADAEDVVGDVFAYLMRKALPRLAQMTEQQRHATLALAVRNRAKSLLRKQNRFLSLSSCYAAGDGRHGSEAPDREVMELIEARELKRSINKALDKLPPALFETMYLYIAGNLTGTEIAELTGVKVSTVYKRIKRGKQLLGKSTDLGGYKDE